MRHRPQTSERFLRRKPGRERTDGARECIDKDAAKSDAPIRSMPVKRRSMVLILAAFHLAGGADGAGFGWLYRRYGFGNASLAHAAARLIAVVPG